MKLENVVLELKVVEASTSFTQMVIWALLVFPLEMFQAMLEIEQLLFKKFAALGV